MLNCYQYAHFSRAKKPIFALYDVFRPLPVVCYSGNIKTLILPQHDIKMKPITASAVGQCRLLKSLCFTPSAKGGTAVSEKSKKTKTDDGRQPLKHAPGTVGGATGSAIGVGLASIAFPGSEEIGAIVGSAAGNLLSGLGQDIWERHLSRREKQRLGTVFDVMVTEIHRRRENGEALRDDGFFEEKQGDRSDADEVAESVLLKAQREPEEKKIEYMGYLFASIAFNPEISVQMAHQLTKIAEQLTYRQLCILRLSRVKDKYGLRDKDYRDQNPFERELYEVLYECADLHNKEYINFGGEVAPGLTNAIPSGMALQAVGRDLYNLMRLCLIPDADIARIVDQLK